MIRMPIIVVNLTLIFAAILEIVEHKKHISSARPGWLSSISAVLFSSALFAASALAYSITSHSPLWHLGRLDRTDRMPYRMMHERSKAINCMHYWIIVAE